MSDDRYSDGYPYFDEDRLRRSPHDERNMYGLDRAHDPHSPTSSRMDGEPSYHPRYERQPIPPLTFTGSPRQLQRERRRPWIPDTERRGPYPGYMRYSQTPPPPRRTYRRNVDSFNETFRDLERPARSRNHSPNWGAEGPPRDPLRRSRSESRSADCYPYGGGRAPRDHFRPGGDFYDYERIYGRRHESLERPDRSGFDDQAQRRDDYYYARIGEPGGLAAFDAYERRRRHEEAMARERRREEEHRRAREHERRSRD